MSKGSTFEREVCKQLSIWWSSGIRDDIFWRTAGSGARATVRSKRGLATSDSYGDISAIHPSGKPLTDSFIISLKRGYTAKLGKKSVSKLSITDLIDRPSHIKTKPLLEQWVEELRAEVKLNNKKSGIIICRRDWRSAIILLEHNIFSSIEKQKACISPLYSAGCHLQLRGIDMQIMRLEDFYFWCDPFLLNAPLMLRPRGTSLSSEWIKPGPNPKDKEQYELALISNANKERSKYAC